MAKRGHLAIDPLQHPGTQTILGAGGGEGGGEDRDLVHPGYGDPSPTDVATELVGAGQLVDLEDIPVAHVAAIDAGLDDTEVAPVIHLEEVPALYRLVDVEIHGRDPRDPSDGSQLSLGSATSHCRATAHNSVKLVMFCVRKAKAMAGGRRTRERWSAGRKKSPAAQDTLHHEVRGRRKSKRPGIRPLPKMWDLVPMARRARRAGGFAACGEREHMNVRPGP